jgi:hypothetical protein
MNLFTPNSPYYHPLKYSLFFLKHPVHFIVVQRWLQTAVSSQPTENLTRVYMNLFTQNSPYYHPLKYLLFFLKHPVYFIVVQCRLQTTVSSHPLKIGHMFIWTYLLRIVHIATPWNIYYTSWNTLYIDIIVTHKAYN